MTIALAPVLGRIAEIESRFRAAPPLGQFPAAGPNTNFEAAYATATASLAAPLGEGVPDAHASGPGAYGAASLSTAAMPAWSGIGSSGWVYPNGAPAVGATAGGFPPADLGGSLSPVGGVGAAPTGSVPAGTPFGAEFEAAGARHGVPPRLLAAVGWVESRYQTDAVSSAGAEGVMQLMPFVSEHYGVNPWDPAQAIDAAGKLLAEHFARFGSWDLALAAYNAGAGAVSAAGNQPPSANVAGYVAKVNERMEQM